MEYAVSILKKYYNRLMNYFYKPIHKNTAYLEMEKAHSFHTRSAIPQTLSAKGNRDMADLLRSVAYRLKEVEPINPTLLDVLLSRVGQIRVNSSSLLVLSMVLLRTSEHLDMQSNYLEKEAEECKD